MSDRRSDFDNMAKPSDAPGDICPPSDQTPPFPLVVPLIRQTSDEVSSSVRGCYCYPRLIPYKVAILVGSQMVFLSTVARADDPDAGPLCVATPLDDARTMYSGDCVLPSDVLADNAAAVVSGTAIAEQGKINVISGMASLQNMSPDQVIHTTINVEGVSRDVVTTPGFGVRVALLNDRDTPTLDPTEKPVRAAFKAFSSPANLVIREGSGRQSITLEPCDTADAGVGGAPAECEDFAVDLISKTGAESCAISPDNKSERWMFGWGIGAALAGLLARRKQKHNPS